jgi:hypothetical protein
MYYQSVSSFCKRGFFARIRLLSCLLLAVLAFPVESVGVEVEPEAVQVPQSVDMSGQPLPAPQPEAVRQDSTGSQQPFEVPVLGNLLETADAPRDYWSGRFASFANDVDRFFGDPRYFQEANKSVLQLNIAKVFEPGGAGNVVLDGQAKMDLPSTERRFSLMLESNPEKNLSADTSKQRPVLANDVVTSNNQSAAIRYEKPPEESRWHFSADTGVKVRVPLEPFVRSRASYTLPMENWRMKAAETVFWFSSIGAGETTQVDFERIIIEPVLFRATSTATWMNDTHNFDLRQDFSFYHTVNERTAMLYQASTIGVSEPQLEATEYVLLMLYRYRLHKSWVFFELSPQLHYPKAKNFDMSPMLLMRLEFLFDGSR